MPLVPVDKLRIDREQAAVPDTVPASCNLCGERSGVRTSIKLLVTAGVAGLVGVLAVSWWVNRDTLAAVSIETAVEEAADSEASDGPLVLDGTFIVSSTAESFAGVRIDEELRGVGAVTAVLRTPDVTGEATLDGSVLTALSITVDLTTLASDDARRDRSLPTALDFVNFPSATFVLDQPVDMAGLDAGASVSVAVNGTLTINGVSLPAVADVTVDTTVGALVAVAQIPVTFADFGVQLPSAPIVLSIADDGIIETQLRFLPA
jgi:polyisoprenoid-binding protein YceI